MAPLDRHILLFYWSTIVYIIYIYIALSGTTFELLDVAKYRDLKILVRGHSRSFKVVPFESLGVVSYSPFIVIMAVSLTVYEIFSVKIWRDLESWVRSCSSH